MQDVVHVLNGDAATSGDMTARYQIRLFVRSPSTLEGDKPPRTNMDGFP
jgi:hypothetical protein